MLSLHYSFFFNDTATTEIYTLSLHDALPIYRAQCRRPGADCALRKDYSAAHPANAGHGDRCGRIWRRSEEHTSELQSQFHLVCRLLLEKKKKNKRVICDNHERGIRLNER